MRMAEARRSDSRRNRARVLAAASEVFGRHGASASTEEVAALAGVGIATVFRHFPTKQALLEAVLQDKLDRMVGEAREIIAGGRPDGFFALFELFLARAREKRVVGDLLTHAGEGFRSSNEAGVAELWSSFSTLLRRGQEAGRVRPDVDLEDVQALLAGAHQALQSFGGDPVREQRLWDVLSDGLRR
jgi:AcrR family transcriptional regulator